MLMSYTDIQAQVSLLPLEDRNQLSRYLTALETEDELRVLLSQRMRAMDAGRSVSLDAFKEKHEQLEAEKNAFVENLFNGNAAEGINAFLEKRPPQFKA